MDLQYFQTLKTILEEGSFQKAAQRLNYTQSTVSAQIQQLEKELSVRLFERIGRKMCLTQAGQAILPDVEMILQTMEKLRWTSKDRDALSGQLRVVMPESFLCYCLQPVLRKFHELAPKVLLSLRTDTGYGIHRSVLTGEADLGVDYQIRGVSENLRITPLASYGLVLVCAPQFPRDQRDFITPGQKKAVSVLVSSPDNLYRRMFEQYLERREISLCHTMELWSIEARKKSVVSNLGVACLPRFVVEEELNAGTLEEIPLAMEQTVITAYELRHKNKWVSPAMDLFIHLLRQGIGVMRQTSLQERDTP